MNGKAMTEGKPWKHVLRFAFPVLFGFGIGCMVTWLYYFSKRWTIIKPLKG